MIEVCNLSKEFTTQPKRKWWRRSRLAAGSLASKVALAPTSFQIQQGETIGFIGPNGAGKSTTIKMLTGILHPTSGDARVLDLCPWKDRTKLSYQISTVFGQKSQLWYHLPPQDTFTLMGKIYELDRATFQKRKNELIERFQLGPLMNTAVRKLSLGERMRCEIALSFLHHPRILFLDEPTIGLDVLVKQNIRELISELNQQEGVTVFLTSHDASDIEALCNRVQVINAGNLVFDGPTEELVTQYLHYKDIRFTLLQSDFDFRAPGVQVIRDGQFMTLRVDLRYGDVKKVMYEVITRFQFADIQVTEPSMEEIIREIYTAHRVSGEIHSEGRIG